MRSSYKTWPHIILLSVKENSAVFDKRDKGDSLIPCLVKNRSAPATKVQGFNQTRVTTTGQVDG